MDNLLAPLGLGAVAGLAVAMPVGPVAVLLLGEAVARGFRVAAGAALGVAAVDAGYAVLAVLAVLGGSAVSDLLLGAERRIGLLGAAVLGAVGVRGLWQATRPGVPAGAVPAAATPGGGSEISTRRGGTGPTANAGSPATGSPAAGPPATSSPQRAFLRFAALTAVNPLTALTFLAVVVGLAPAAGADAACDAAAWLFVLGVTAASASWQLALATAGAALGRRLGRRASTWLSAAGHLVVLGLAVVMTARA